MNSWKMFDETSFPHKKRFCISLNMEDITDVDHRHAKSVWKYFKINGEYYDFYIQRDTLLLADVFQKFRNKYIEIY